MVSDNGGRASACPPLHFTSIAHHVAAGLSASVELMSRTPHAAGTRRGFARFNKSAPRHPSIETKCQEDKTSDD